MQGGGQSLAAENEGDFVQKSFCFTRVDGTGAELGEFGRQAGMLGDVDVGWKIGSRHVWKV